MNDVKLDPRGTPPPSLAPLAPALMMAFWILLGGATGIKLLQTMWHLLGWEAGRLSVAVPIGGVLGAAGAVLVGWVSNPRVLVLLMAVFAGSAAGSVAGRLAWGEIGEIAGQVGGGSVGGLAWATWLSVGGGRNRPGCG